MAVPDGSVVPLHYILVPHPSFTLFPIEGENRRLRFLETETRQLAARHPRVCRITTVC